jgi:S-adenosylmethionine/arginine decarboxylase-like enzyme
MRNIAPDIMRQRLLIEGMYTVDVDAGKAENQGYDVFIPLIDSGISLYVWSEQKLFAALLFTCKAFSDEGAVSYARDFSAPATPII